MKFLEEYKFPKDTYYLSLSFSKGSVNMPKLPKSIEVLEIIIGEYPVSFPHLFPSKIKELKFLSAARNMDTIGINILPNISYLKKLWYLEMEDFGLVSLPENLPDSLRIIMANRNKIKKVPKKLPKNLVFIEISNNLLTSLPELAYLKKLDVFSAHNNKIKKIFKVFPGPKAHVYINSDKVPYPKLSNELIPYFKKGLLA